MRRHLLKSHLSKMSQCIVLCFFERVINFSNFPHCGYFRSFSVCQFCTLPNHKSPQVLISTTLVALERKPTKAQSKFELQEKAQNILVRKKSVDETLCCLIIFTKASTFLFLVHIFILEVRGRRAKRSSVWEYFTDINTTGSIVKCSVCSAILSRTDQSTTSMRSHLRARHKINVQSSRVAPSLR